MKVPEIIPVETTGHCDVETGECITVESTAPGREMSWYEPERPEETTSPSGRSDTSG